jgi:hypothetical protein
MSNPTSVNRETILELLHEIGYDFSKPGALDDEEGLNRIVDEINKTYANFNEDVNVTEDGYFYNEVDNVNNANDGYRKTNNIDTFSRNGQHHYDNVDTNNEVSVNFSDDKSQTNDFKLNPIHSKTIYSQTNHKLVKNIRPTNYNNLHQNSNSGTCDDDEGTNIVNEEDVELLHLFQKFDMDLNVIHQTVNSQIIQNSPPMVFTES